MNTNTIIKCIAASFAAAVIACLILGIVGAVGEYNKEQTLWKEENACIASFISQKVERRDIVRDNGSCYVRGYY